MAGIGEHSIVDQINTIGIAEGSGTTRSSLPTSNALTA
jgi:hypothetical protein